jgi:hypothetical protein
VGWQGVNVVVNHSILRLSVPLQRSRKSLLRDTAQERAIRERMSVEM